MNESVVGLFVGVCICIYMYVCSDVYMCDYVSVHTRMYLRTCMSVEPFHLTLKFDSEKAGISPERRRKSFTKPFKKSQAGGRRNKNSWRNPAALYSFLLATACLLARPRFMGSDSLSFIVFFCFTDSLVLIRFVSFVCSSMLPPLSLISSSVSFLFFSFCFSSSLLFIFPPSFFFSSLHAPSFLTPFLLFSPPPFRLFLSFSPPPYLLHIFPSFSFSPSHSS